MRFLNFKKKELIESKFFQLHQLLRASFAHVKSDTSLIFQWLNYFNQKIIQQDQKIIQQDTLINNLKNELSLLPKKEDIKKIIDETYYYEDLLNRLHNIEKRLSLGITTPDISEIQTRLEKLEQKKTNIKERLIKRITRNSKEYVKSVILSLIKKYEKIPALQLKEMIVDEQGLCSKSSFYRLLEEIEVLEDIGVIREGKEKHYIGKLTKQHN